VTGLDEHIGMSHACPTGDAMPSGAGTWADPGSHVWAPSVVLWNGVHHLYYGAFRRGQVCLGRAVSSTASIRGPYVWQTLVRCAPGGRWSLDPDAFVHAGRLYLVFRDDAVTGWPQTGIAVVEVDALGAPIWATRRALLVSQDVTWEHGPDPHSASYVVENPSMMRIGDGHFYLFFSGNDWDSDRYATGVADCGTSPRGVASHRCTVLGATAQPYFGHVAPHVTPPLFGLPDNRPGPGGMSLFRTHAGRARVVWSFFSYGRWSMAGVLSFRQGAFAVT
jgi:arabinan endo-1,5-alpha-L-arabinosidase